MNMPIPTTNIFAKNNNTSTSDIFSKDNVPSHNIFAKSSNSVANDKKK
jgi:hypothetical protein